LDPPVFKESDEASFKIVDNTLSRVKLGYTYQYDNPTDIFSAKHPGKVSIVGAGPGDKKLLTLKAAEAIRSADVILYDNLVSDEILQLAQTSELHYVGRKYADHSCQKERQSNINEQLHHHYKQGKQVVRLKSGDPYIYGRAAEEARYLAAQDIPFEVVPGISAALAAANLFNIPITERNKSNALMICTAHTADYSFDQLNGIAALLKAGNALAIYMGLKSLDKLIPKLIEVCHDDLIPISAVSNVSRDKEHLITSTLKDIREDISRETLSMPVVFLVGAKPIKS
ncbi:MAG: uroporphyrinogen-III C-methyltransferase, partial [Bacteroidota bacterium]